MQAHYLALGESAQYYECGFSCDHAVVVRVEEARFFITDSRYTLEARESCHAHTQVIESNDFIQSIGGIIAQQGIRKLGFDSLELSLDFYERLKSSVASLKCELLPMPNFHQRLRICKSPQEIALIHKSQRLNKKAFKHFASYLAKNLKSAPSERELHYHALQFLSHFGKYDVSFNPIVGINANAAKPHALPSLSTRLGKRDLLLFDAGIKYKRYCSDMTRTAAVGADMSFSKKQRFVSKIQNKVYDIVRKAQERAITKARSGMSGREIDALAREVIEKSGYGKYFTHSTGHGVGLDIHELPRISRSSEERIEDGMVFSIEPGIYLPNDFGVRIEDLVVMKNGRAEVL